VAVSRENVMNFGVPLNVRNLFIAEEVLKKDSATWTS
jgi:hypothetical protein